MIFTTYVLVAIAVWISGVDATQISPIDSQGQYSTAVHSETPENARPVSPSRLQDPNFDASTELQNSFHIGNKDHRYKTLRERRGFAKQGGTTQGANADFRRENPSLASAPSDEADVDAGSRFPISYELGGEEVLNPRQILNPSASTLSISSTLPGEGDPTSVTKNPFSSVSSAGEEPAATNSIASTISSLEQSPSRQDINRPNAATGQSSSPSMGSQSVVTSTKDGSMPSFSGATASTGKSGTIRSSDRGSVPTRSGHGKLKNAGASSLAPNNTVSSSQGAGPSSRIAAMSSSANSVMSPSSQSTGPSSSNLPRSATSLTSLSKILFMSGATTNSPSLVGSKLPSKSNSPSITSSQTSLTILDPKNANAFPASTSLFSRSSSSVSPNSSSGTSQQSSTIGLASSRSKGSTKIKPSSSSRTSWLLTSSTSVIISPSSSKLIALSTAMRTAIRSGLSSSIHSSSPTIAKSISTSQSGKASAPRFSQSSIAHQASITGTSIYGRSTKSLESTSGKSSSASLAGVINSSSLARGGRSSAVGPSNSKFTSQQSSIHSTSIIQSSRSLISGPSIVSSYAEVITSGSASMSNTSNSASSSTSRPSVARIIAISQSSQSHQVTFSKSSETISAGASRAVADISSDLNSAKFQKTVVSSISSQISFQRTLPLSTGSVSATAGSVTKIIQGSITRSSSVMSQTTRSTSKSASGQSRSKSLSSTGSSVIRSSGTSSSIAVDSTKPFASSAMMSGMRTSISKEPSGAANGLSTGINAIGVSSMNTMTTSSHSSKIISEFASMPTQTDPRLGSIRGSSKPTSGGSRGISTATASASVIPLSTASSLTSIYSEVTRSSQISWAAGISKQSTAKSASSGKSLSGTQDAQQTSPSGTVKSSQVISGMSISRGITTPTISETSSLALSSPISFTTRSTLISGDITTIAKGFSSTKLASITAQSGNGFTSISTQISASPIISPTPLNNPSNTPNITVKASLSPSIDNYSGKSSKEPATLVSQSSITVIIQSTGSSSLITTAGSSGISKAATVILPSTSSSPGRSCPIGCAQKIASASPMPSNIVCGTKGYTRNDVNSLGNALYGPNDVTAQGCAMDCFNIPGCTSFYLGDIANPFCEPHGPGNQAFLQFTPNDGSYYYGYDIGCFDLVCDCTSTTMDRGAPTNVLLISQQRSATTSIGAATVAGKPTTQSTNRVSGTGNSAVSIKAVALPTVASGLTSSGASTQKSGDIYDQVLAASKTTSFGSNGGSISDISSGYFNSNLRSIPQTLSPTIKLTTSTKMVVGQNMGTLLSTSSSKLVITSSATTSQTSGTSITPGQNNFGASQSSPPAVGMSKPQQSLRMSSGTSTSATSLTLPNLKAAQSGVSSSTTASTLIQTPVGAGDGGPPSQQPAPVTNSEQNLTQGQQGITGGSGNPQESPENAQKGSNNGQQASDSLQQGSGDGQHSPGDDAQQASNSVQSNSQQSPSNSQQGSGNDQALDNDQVQENSQNQVNIQGESKGDGHSQDSGHSQGNNQMQGNGAEVGQDQGTGKQGQSQGHQGQDGGQSQGNDQSQSGVEDGQGQGYGQSQGNGQNQGSSQGQGISQPEGTGQSQGSGSSQGNTGNGQQNGQSQGNGELQGGQNGGQRPPIDAPPKANAGDGQGPDSGPQNSPSNGGGIQLDPESINKISSKVNPSSASKTDRSRPIVTNNFNFYDGTMLINGPIDSDTKVTQAQFINGALPSSIQNAFNSNEINYYDPGTGDFYYAKRCNKISCSIVQIGRSCGCYTNAIDHQQHYLLAESTTSLELLIPNQSETIPNALDYMVQNGENNQDIANVFGVPLELLRAANRQISNFNTIYSGQNLIVPAQAYLIRTGDSLSSIAAYIQSTVAVLLALNPEITYPDYLLPGYFIRTPARLPNVPFAYTVHEGDALGNLANLYGITVEALENLNPQILNKEEIFTKEIIRIPSYLPFEERGQRFVQALNSRWLDKEVQDLWQENVLSQGGGKMVFE